MKTITLIIAIPFVFALSALSQNNGKSVSLFNGKDLNSWNLDKTGGFEIAGSELITRSSGGGNDIFTKKEYTNFVLRLEFMLSKVGNSGVFIRCKPNDPPSGFEVQLLAPWTPWRDDLHCTGSMYGYVAVTNRPDETTGVWYKMEIKCDRNLVTISVNDKVVTMANTDTVKKMSDKPFSGVIGLQGNHAEEKEQWAKFRNISILDLDADPAYVIKGLSVENAQLRGLASAALVRLGANMIRPLAGVMSGDNPMAKSEAKQALFDIVAKASDPQATKKDKKAVRATLKKSMKSSSSEITAEYLKWLAGLLGD